LAAKAIKKNKKMNNNNNKSKYSWQQNGPFKNKSWVNTTPRPPKPPTQPSFFFCAGLDNVRMKIIKEKNKLKARIADIKAQITQIRKREKNHVSKKDSQQTQQKSPSKSVPSQPSKKDLQPTQLKSPSIPVSTQTSSSSHSPTYSPSPLKANVFPASSPSSPEIQLPSTSNVNKISQSDESTIKIKIIDSLLVAIVDWFPQEFGAKLTEGASAPIFVQKTIKDLLDERDKFVKEQDQQKKMIDEEQQKKTEKRKRKHETTSLPPLMLEWNDLSKKKGTKTKN